MLKLKTWTFCKIKLRGAKKGNSFKGCTSKCCSDFVTTNPEQLNCIKMQEKNYMFIASSFCILPE